MITYIPKYVKQDSDLEYNSIVTHENYNEKLNLNTTQGDYNTDVLATLFGEVDINKAYRIPYLEKYISDKIDDIDTNLEQINANTDAIRLLKIITNEHDTEIDKMLDGDLTVGHAHIADTIAGADTAAAHTYYGKNLGGAIGFHQMPKAIFTEPLESGAEEISGIYFVPRVNSVAESMLTDEVRIKLNRSSITDYDDLTSRPQIEGTVLTGNKTLTELGIQPVGAYLTEVPAEYVTDSELSSALNSYMKTSSANSTFATIGNLNALENKVNAIPGSVASTYARVFIGSVPDGYSPKEGDLLIAIA